MPRPMIIKLLIVSVMLALIETAVGQTHDKDHPWDFKPDFADRAAWEQRAEFLRRQVLVSQGLWPMPAKSPLSPVIHGKIERDDYTVEKVFFASLPGHYVSGNLYRPKNRAGKLPVVLCPYGHWPNGRFIWKSDEDIKKDLASGAEKDPSAARSPLQANCVSLARMGCVVFHYDMVGFGDSTKIEHRTGFLDAEAALRAQSFMGLQTWNGIRALDFVLSLPDVDPSRVAVTGSSGGGTQTFMLAAVDPRVTATFPMVMVSMNMQGGCVCENAPLLRVRTNNVELASLSAPKPLGAAAANDWTHDFLTRGLPEMKSIWRLYSAEENVTGDHVDYGHNHNFHSRLLQYAFLNRHFKLGQSEPLAEKPFEPIEPKQLSVYDDDHPPPADATDAGGVRQWMTRASDEAIAEIAKDPAEHRKLLMTALQAMVVEEMSSRSRDNDDLQITWSKQADFKGHMIVWPHGPTSAEKFHASGSAVITFNFRAPAQPMQAKNPPPYASYAGFTHGYERRALASQVHDLLSAIAAAKAVDGVKRVTVIGLGKHGPAALLACVLADQSADRLVMSKSDFDFNTITDANDPMLLPGAFKYGGLAAFAKICRARIHMVDDAEPDMSKLAEVVK